MMLKRDTVVGCFAHTVSPSPGRRLTSVLLLSLTSIFGLFGLVSTSHAQATSTADKGGQIDAFGAFTFTSPDYGPQKNTGGTIGGAFLLRKLILGQPGFAVRYVHTSGTTTTETFFGGGLESHYRIGPVRPYATILYGIGGLSVPTIPTATGHYSDSGNTVLVGGGADIPFNLKFAARAEFTYSFVTITGLNNTPSGQLSLTPASFNIGVVYHVK